LDETEAAVSQIKKLTLVEKRKQFLMQLISLEELLKKCWTYMMLWITAAPDRFTCYILVRKLAIEEIMIIIKEHYF
jgi:hypothetical protein